MYDGAGGREAVCSADEAAAGCDAVPVPRALHEVTGGCAEDEDVGVAGDGDARAVVRGGGVFFDRGERGRGEGRGERGGGHAGGGQGGTLLGGRGGTHAEDGAASKLAPPRPRAGGSLGGVGEDQVEEMHAPALSDDGKGGAPVAPLGGEVGALLEDRLGRPRVPPDATPVAAAAPNLNRGWGDERRRPRASVVFQSHRRVVSARGGAGKHPRPTYREHRGARRRRDARVVALMTSAGRAELSWKTSSVCFKHAGNCHLGKGRFRRVTATRTCPHVVFSRSGPRGRPATLAEPSQYRRRGWSASRARDRPRPGRALQVRRDEPR